MVGTSGLVDTFAYILHFDSIDCFWTYYCIGTMQGPRTVSNNKFVSELTQIMVIQSTFKYFKLNITM